MREVRVDSTVTIGFGRPLALIAGPCVLEEDFSVSLSIASELKAVCQDLDIPLIFKASYEKDNRGSASSYKGPLLKAGLAMLQEIKARLDIPVLSDIHRVEDVDEAAPVLDILQVPAYLCQQTSLLLKVGAAGKPVNVKKGQFLAPQNMSSAVSKLESVDNHQILLTERGSCFGYNRLISDISAIPIMQRLGYPVVFDATHIIRIYGASSADPQGGEPEFVPHLCRAAIAAGCNALFLETHPRPAEASCDAASMVSLADLKQLLPQFKELSETVRRWSIA